MPEANEPRAEVIVRELVERYYRPVCLFFMRRGLPTEDSEDLAQETFLRVFQRIGSLRDPPSARPWLFAIAANVLRNELRTRGAEKRQKIEEPVQSLEIVQDPDIAESLRRPEKSLDPEAVAEVLAREKSALLAVAVRDLPPRMRRAVMMRIGQDLKYREIAAAMQVSIDTVKSQLGQARERLQKQLGEHFDDIAKDEQG